MARYVGTLHCLATSNRCSDSGWSIGKRQRCGLNVHWGELAAAALVRPLKAWSSMVLYRRSSGSRISRLRLSVVWRAGSSVPEAAPVARRHQPHLVSVRWGEIWKRVDGSVDGSGSEVARIIIVASHSWRLRRSWFAAPATRLDVRTACVSRVRALRVPAGVSLRLLAADPFFCVIGRCAINCHPPIQAVPGRWKI